MQDASEELTLDERQQCFADFFSFVIDQFDQEIQLNDLAAAASMTPWVLCRQFQKSFGISPMRWLWRFRILLARECLQLVPNWHLTDISVLCGFSSLAHFSRQFRNAFGETPSQFRNQMLEQVPTTQREPSQLLFEDLATDRRELLELVVRKALELPKKAG